MKMLQKNLVNKISLFIILYFIVSCKTSNVGKIKASKFLNCATLSNNKKYSVQELIKKLHDSSFCVSEDKQCSKCIMSIMITLGKKYNCRLHYNCDFIGCFYPDMAIWRSDASVYRYDLRKLMHFSHFKDSTEYINKYHKPFAVTDSINIVKYAKYHKLNPINLEPIFSEG